MRYFRLLVYVLLFLFSFTFTIALSITPSVQDLQYVPGEVRTISFTTSGAEKIGVDLGGILASHSKLLTPTEMTGCANGPCSINVEITIPNLEDQPGRNDLSVVVTEMPLTGEFAGGISAVPRIIGIVRMLVPYPGKYLEAKLVASSDKVNVGQKVQFTALVTSFGGETVNKIIGNLNIFPLGPGEDKFTLEFPSAEGLGPGQTLEMKTVWDTTGINPGRYKAVANLSYDEGKSAFADIFGLDIGDRLVKILSVNPLTFTTGKIQKVQVEVRNYWNEVFDVYVNLKLKDDSSSVLTESDSKSIELDKGAGGIDTFIDLSNVNPGDYILEVTTFFDEGLNYSQNFNVVVLNGFIDLGDNEADKIEKEHGGSGFLYLLVGLIILIILGTFFYLRKKKLKEEDSF
ncbi:MAG: hypothetical protein ABIH82_04555 [Candidatus Woesearchaeota archaeon]|nr:hypothetical protein [Nanoarchaeota archaeon]MBU1622698.1 hypothetical protein [Nanoarchaeota archaeon]MBU1974244.1 hypothetical protein [Nanoarchaeota archaeon]